MLVKSHHVYLTDFGTTLDWSDTGHDTTTGLASGLTLRYSAPEVATNQPRNTSADIWSLGCVFLEIWTELCDHSTSELKSFMEDQGTKSSLYYANISAATEWCDMLSSGTDNDAQIPNPWIRSMLEDDPSTRCSIQSLTEDIQVSNFGSGVADSFSGLCCNGGFIDAESVLSSDYQASIMISNQRDTASRALSSADTVVSSDGVLKHDVMSSRLIVEERRQSLNHRRFVRRSTPRRPKITFPKKHNGSPRVQSHQKPIGTVHEEPETARHADWSPDVDDEYTSLRSRYGVRQVRSSQHATILNDIEVSSRTSNHSPDILTEKMHKTYDSVDDAANSQYDLHDSDSSSDVIYVYSIEHPVAPHPQQQKHERTHVQTGNTKHEPSMLQPPTVDDKRSVNEVIYQWLTNFDPSTYRKITTIEVVGQHNVLMYRLGRIRDDPELSPLYRFYTNYGWHQVYTFSEKLARRIQGFHPGKASWTNHFVNIVNDAWHVLDSIHVPYVGSGCYFYCFFPKSILLEYDCNSPIIKEGLRSFELLKLKRYEVLQWWHNCLTSPQDIWTEKLRACRIFEVSIHISNQNHNFDFQELTPLSSAHGLNQVPMKERQGYSNTHRHIEAALHHSCRLRSKTIAGGSQSSGAKQDDKAEEVNKVRDMLGTAFFKFKTRKKLSALQALEGEKEFK